MINISFCILLMISFAFFPLLESQSLIRCCLQLQCYDAYNLKKERFIIAVVFVLDDFGLKIFVFHSLLK